MIHNTLTKVFMGKGYVQSDFQIPLPAFKRSSILAVQSLVVPFSWTSILATVVGVMK